MEKASDTSDFPPAFSVKIDLFASPESKSMP